jgi:hypothetical protein
VENWAAGSFRLVDQFGDQVLAAAFVTEDLHDLREGERDYCVEAAEASIRSSMPIEFPERTGGHTIVRHTVQHL